MKKLLIGFGLLATLSSFANSDCSLNIKGLDLTNESIEMLKEKFDITDGESSLELQIGGQCIGNQCAFSVAVMEKTSSGGLTSAGNSAVGYGLDGWYNSADYNAIEDAISKLDSCL